MPRKAEQTKVLKYREPKFIFESAGPVNPKEAYFVPFRDVSSSRKQDIKSMVDGGRYFSLFAPRQSGKTTYLEEIRSTLHKDPTYAAILLSFERYKDLDKGTFYHQLQKHLYPQLIGRLSKVNCNKLKQVETLLETHQIKDHLSFGELFEQLNEIIQYKKIVIFIDEFDGIPVGELENFLTTLRYFYQQYKRVETKALYSIGLVGIRNITKLVVGGVSPFNIADQVVLPAFSLEDVRELFQQYTSETNQPFTEKAVQRIYQESRGQRWLVNRLGTILTVDVKPGTVEPIDETAVEKALELLLKERNDHFDNLYEKAKLYKETFVEIVFDGVEYNSFDEDQTWLEQYGLIKEKSGGAVVSNNIYKAVFVRAFFKEVKAYGVIPAGEYVLPGDLLDMDRILLDFGRYITQIGVAAFYRKGKPYEKTGQFLLTAWLYQFVRDDGQLRYEVRTGLGRLDIILVFCGRKYIIETKVNRRNLNRTIQDGVKQISGKYLSSESVSEGYLVIFDIKTVVGEEIEPSWHQVDDKNVAAYVIGIGRSDEG